MRKLLKLILTAPIMVVLISGQILVSMLACFVSGQILVSGKTSQANAQTP